MIRFKDYLNDYLEHYNISKKEFANRISITPKHLSSILSGESDLSYEVIKNISFITDIPIEFIHNIELSYKQNLNIDKYLKKENLTLTQYLNKFKYNYLIKNNYIEFKNPSDKYWVLKDILKYLRVSTPDAIYNLDKEALYKSNCDKEELLLLWLEKCYRETLKQELNEYKNSNIDIIVNKVREFAFNNIFNEKELIKLFNDNGIFLVIEDDIPGSKIRGAFKVLGTKPAIYITRKHKRIADIYFALFHELAHCKTNFNKAKSKSIVSFENKTSDIEIEADKAAYNWMIENSYYDSAKNLGYQIFEEDKVPKCFAAYRLAQDGLLSHSDQFYQKFNPVIFK